MADDVLLALEIPPEPEYVGAARLFLAAIGRHYALDEESVADMKVAVSEVCAGAAEDLRAAGPLRIAVHPGADELEVEVRPVQRAARAGDDLALEGTPTWEQSLREPLVRALFPEASYQAEAHTLRLVVPMPSLEWEPGPGP